MKKHTVKTKQEYMRALEDILSDERPGIIYYGEDSTDHISVFGVASEFNSDIKTIFSSRWGGSLNTPTPSSTSYRVNFEQVGFYCNGKFVNVATHLLFPYPFFEHTDAFLEGNLVSVKDIFQQIPAKVWEILSSKYPSLESLEQDGFLEHIKEENHEPWDIKALREEIVNQKIKTPSDMFSRISDPSPDLLIMACSELLSLDQLADHIIKTNNRVFWILAEYYLYQQAVQKAKDTLSEAQKIVSAMTHDMREQVKLGSTITIRIKGRDEMLAKSFLREYPDFSIEGTDVVIKEPFSGKFPGADCIFLVDGTLELGYRAKLEPKVKEKSTNRNWEYINRYKVEDIISVTYGKKIFYQKETA